jgi:hypothetical protein
MAVPQRGPRDAGAFLLLVARPLPRNFAPHQAVRIAPSQQPEQEHRMPIWGRLKQELDRASRVAQGAIDEGRVRLEVFRARQRADRAAQALGYAVHRARRAGSDLTPDEQERFSADVARAQAEIERLEKQLADLRRESSADTSLAHRPPPAP